MMVVVTLLLVTVVVTLTTTPSGSTKDRARATLDERLAAGEISADDHRTRAQALKDPPARWRRVLGWGGAILVGGAFVVAARQMNNQMMQMMQMMEGTDMMNGMEMNGMMGFGWIGMVLFVGLVVALIVWLVRRLSPDDRPSSGGDARRLLDERYARGEIDGDEYAERRDALSQ